MTTTEHTLWPDFWGISTTAYICTGKRLKERVFRIYKLNYDALRMIMENQTPDVLPIKAEIENKMTL